LNSGSGTGMRLGFPQPGHFARLPAAESGTLIALPHTHCALIVMSTPHRSVVKVIE
jgi:hypothetical protein